LSPAVIKTTSAFTDNLFFLDGFCIGGATLTAEPPVFQRSPPRDQIKAKSGPNTYADENFSLLIMHI
jgi:hypothetical protein